jgi:GntR family transcriptional regulator/MocR family aminotransferase
MSLSRRKEILGYAAETGAVIVEDDFENEYRYDGRPLASMQSMDRGGSVLYLGSFSKVMFPGLRLGYIVAPPDLIPVLRAACAVAFHSGQMIEQAALAEFILQGHLARHVDRMGRMYRERQEVLLDALARNTADTITAQPAGSGIFLLGRLLPSIDDRAASEAARRHGVIAAPVSAHAMEPLGYGGLLLGYAAHEAVTIRQGVRNLAKALRSVRTSSRHGTDSGRS